MKIVILDGKTLGDDLDLNVFGEDTEIYANTRREEVKNRILDAEAVIVNKIRLNEENLQYAKKLKLICVAATGYDNIDIGYCKRAGIAVCNVTGYSTHSVAQLTVSMVLSLAMHQAEYREFVASGEYTKSGVANRLSPVYRELYGKTWGIVGFGNIGRQVARVAEAFGCEILTFKRTADENYECVGLSELARRSDIITVHLPASDETKGIISGEIISQMKDGVIFVNTARGVVTDEQAVCDAVLSGKIGGAGIDVYSEEPFGDMHCFNKIKDRKNVILTPHIAWGAYEARVRCVEEIGKNIDAFSRGETRNRIV